MGGFRPRRGEQVELVRLGGRPFIKHFFACSEDEYRAVTEFFHLTDEDMGMAMLNNQEELLAAGIQILAEPTALLTPHSIQSTHSIHAIQPIQSFNSFTHSTHPFN